MSAAGPVRVGFLIDTLQPGAGTENQLLFLLREFDRGRIDPHLCLLHGDPEPLGALCPGVPVTVLGFRRLRSPEGLRGLLRLRRWVRGNRLQALKTFFRDAGTVGALGTRGLGVPVIAARRNLGKGYWHTRSELRLLRIVNRATVAWVANSEAVRRYTVEAEGVPGERIAVIPNALDAERFRPAAGGTDRAAGRAALDLPGGLLFVVVANLRPVKGVDIALEAFARTAAHLDGATLVLVGSGDLEPVLRARAMELGLTDRVRFLGSRGDVPDILALADVGVLPSRGEGSSNALLEMAACALPVVATAVGGTPEVVEGARCGRLVPPEDPDAMAGAMLELGRDAALRESLGRGGRAYVLERHDPARVLEAWTSLFEAVARGTFAAGDRA